MNNNNQRVAESSRHSGTGAVVAAPSSVEEKILCAIVAAHQPSDGGVDCSEIKFGQAYHIAEKIGFDLSALVPKRTQEDA